MDNIMILLPFFYLCFIITLSDADGVGGGVGFIIKSNSQKEHGAVEDEKAEGVISQKSLANFEGADGFNKEKGENHAVAKDNGKYNEEAAKKQTNAENSNFNKADFHQNNGEEQGKADKVAAHRKGHHNSGFHHSYHKDEQGSNSSYFDDGSDEGAQHLQKNYRGAFGDSGQSQHNAQNLNNQGYASQEGRQGYYDKGDAIQRGHGNNQGYARNNHYNDQQDLARRNAGSNYQGGGRYQEERFERPIYPQYPPHHLPPQPLPHLPPPVPPHVGGGGGGGGYYHRPETYRKIVPLPERPHITIYEDPRYVRPDPRYRRSDDYVDYDSLELPHRFIDYFNNY